MVWRTHGITFQLFHFHSFDSLSFFSSVALSGLFLTPFQTPLNKLHLIVAPLATIHFTDPGAICAGGFSWGVCHTPFTTYATSRQEFYNLNSSVSYDSCKSQYMKVFYRPSSSMVHSLNSSCQCILLELYD